MNSRLLLVLGLTLYLEFDIFTNCHGLATDSDKRQSKFSSGKKTSSNNFSKFNASDKRYVSTTTMINQKKKWNIERVTSKQHGIVTVLIPKTKLFIDIDYSNLTCKATTTEITPKFQEHATSIAKGLKQKTLLKSIRNKSQSSTPSYIEFYYLDLSDDRIKRKHSNKSSRKFKNESKSNIGRNNVRKSSLASLFKIHVNTVRRKHSVIASQGTKSANNIRKSNIGRTKPSKSKLKDIQQTIKRNSKNRNGQNKISKPPRKQVEYKSKYTKEETVIVSVNNSLSTTTYATAYDKVKFFEMYDNYTPKWHNYDPNNKTNLINDYDTHDKSFHIDGQILFDRENEDIFSQQNINKTKFVKKHNMRNIKNEDISLSHLIKQDLSYTSERPVVSKKVFQNVHKKSNSFKAVLSDFPFVAVYIYEPLQVRCDAAGISPHWLLAAGSCLARHRRELRGGALSAFVTFCSEDWRHPQMISYVKRTLIHPHFRPNDKLRRYLFNAGLVQVVNSLDSCNGWAPVTLISHHFTADQQGTTGTAIGWGLDRYDDKYSVTEISRHPLMKYEDTVYSQSCPGNTEYSNAHSPDEDGFSNVYCLSLPPYLSEENDTVHGALLLIGGKLLALYLQEERRAWGEQSAQYTGLWRLLPWLAETAREPDDTFPIEI